jgi:hypothetical protein
MRFDSVASSVLKEDPFQLQAVEVLLHLLQYQNVEGNIGKSSGENAANYCADFITTFAERLRAMPKR